MASSAPSPTLASLMQQYADSMTNTRNDALAQLGYYNPQPQYQPYSGSFPQQYPGSPSTTQYSGITSLVEWKYDRNHEAFCRRKDGATIDAYELNKLGAANGLTDALLDGYFAEIKIKVLLSDKSVKGEKFKGTRDHQKQTMIGAFNTSLLGTATSRAMMSRSY
jgi:hypothetical protein